LGVGEDVRRDHVQRLSVGQAADQLGVSVDAVRSRIKRGTIAHERKGRRVYVLMDTDQDRPELDQPTDRPGGTNTLISQLREEIAYLREENRRKDEIIMQQALNVRQLTAAPPEPAEARESPPTVTAEEGSGVVTKRPVLETSEASKELSLWGYVLGIFLVGIPRQKPPGVCVH
jgi:excisionase family DNA binding protein